MIYDTDKDTDEFILNPHHDAFKVISVQEAANAKPEDLKDRFVTVIYDDLVTDEQQAEVTKHLTDMGVLDVRSESVVEKAIREHVVDVGAVESASAEALVEPFVKSVLTGDSQLVPDIVVQFGKAIIKEINERENAVSSSGTIFNGEISSITMENFMGIQGSITLDFTKMTNGIWYFEGANGSGKSTILEAIVWGYFDEQIRSDVKVDDVVNDVVGRNTRVIIAHTNGYTIERFRKHSELGSVGFRVYKDGVRIERFEKAEKVAAQAMLNELLGTDYSKMIKSNILGQNITANFISAGEKERRAMIENMLGLEKFDLYLEKVRNMKKDLVQQADTQEEIQRLRSAANVEYSQKINDMSAQLGQAEKAHENNLSILDMKRRAVEQDIQVLPQKHEVEMKEGKTKAAFAEDNFIKAQAVVRNFASFEASLATKNAELEALKTKETSLSASEMTFSRAVEVLGKERVALQVKIANTKGEINGIKSVDEVKVKTTHAQIKERRAFELQISNLLRERHSVKNTVLADYTRLAKESDRLIELSKTAGSKCPVCTQPVSANNLTVTIADLGSEIADLANTLNEIDNTIRTNTESYNTHVKQTNDLEISVVSEVALASILAKLSGLEKSLAEDEAAEAAIPDRARTLYESHRQSLSKIMGCEVQSYADAGLLLETIRSNIMGDIDKIKSSVDPQVVVEAKGALLQAEQDRRTAEAVLTTLQATFEATMASRRQQLVSLEDEIKRTVANNPADTIKATIKSLQDSQQKAFADMEAAKRLAFAINLKQAYVTFWEKAFQAKGSMRAFLLDGSVAKLNLLLLGYTSQHFGGKMPLTFNSDLTIKERYGRRSGGQRKWTDLCALLSLFELAQQRSRYRSTFLALDEVFDALDSIGRRAVLEIVNLLAVRVKHILIITHVDVSGATRAGTISATMTDAGTTLQVRPQ